MSFDPNRLMRFVVVTPMSRDKYLFTVVHAFRVWTAKIRVFGVSRLLHRLPLLLFSNFREILTFLSELVSGRGTARRSRVVEGCCPQAMQPSR